MKYVFLFCRSNNPILLRFLHSLPKTLDDDLLIELIIRILKNSQDLVSPYLSGYQMALDPRNSQQWLNNVVFLIKLYFHLPMARSVFKNPAISVDRVATSKFLTVVCPENVKRNILTRGLQVRLDFAVQKFRSYMVAAFIHGVI